MAGLIIKGLRQFSRGCLLAFRRKRDYLESTKKSEKQEKNPKSKILRADLWSGRIECFTKFLILILLR